MLVRRGLSFIAAVIAAVALLVVLYHQFERDDAGWPGLILSGAIFVVWFAGGWPRTAELAGWAARGLILTAAAAYYATVRLDEPRLDAGLAAFAAGMIAAQLVQLVGRSRSGGTVNWAFLRGRRRVVTLVRWVAYLCAAVAGRYLGYWLAVVMYWVPVHALVQFRDWWATDWLALPAAVLVWVLWAVVVGVGLGVLQSHEVRRQRVTHGQRHSWGQPPGHLLGTGTYNYTTYSTTHEQFEEKELTRPPLRTGLTPLVQLRHVDGGWTDTTSTGGTWDSMSSTTYSEGAWRVRLFQLPPAYLPVWLNRLVAALRRR